MSLRSQIVSASSRLWMNWPLWGGLLAMLLLAKHMWILFAPSDQAISGTTVAAESAQVEQLFGSVDAATSSASLNGIRPIGIFASRKQGFAVMQTPSGQVGVGVGEQVVPGVRLIETHADHVILERNGVRQRVDLGNAPATAGGINTAQTATAHGDPIAAAQGQMLEQMAPEQRTMLQQQRESMRGRF